jgi:hypothetical protein
MTQQETKSLLLDAIDELNLIFYYKDLLRLGIEQADTFDETKFNRLIQLTEIFDTYLNCSITNIERALIQLKESAYE